MYQMEHRDQKRFERLSILVVDDNEHTVDLITQILSAFGVRDISSAADGASALRFLHRKSVDLVICDWEMKPLDGLAFTKRVRKSPESPNPFVPIIMLTGHTEAERVIKARNAGVNDFVAKPISPAVLFSRMVSVLDHWNDFISSGSCLGPQSGPESEAEPAPASPISPPSPGRDRAASKAKP